MNEFFMAFLLQRHRLFIAAFNAILHIQILHINVWCTKIELEVCVGAIRTLSRIKKNAMQGVKNWKIWIGNNKNAIQELHKSNKCKYKYKKCQGILREISKKCRKSSRDRLDCRGNCHRTLAINPDYQICNVGTRHAKGEPMVINTYSEPTNTNTNTDIDERLQYSNIYSEQKRREWVITSIWHAFSRNSCYAECLSSFLWKYTHLTKTDTSTKGSLLYSI